MPAPRGNRYAARPVATHKSKQVNVRMTEQQYQALTEAARQQGQSLNAYVRIRLGLEVDPLGEIKSQSSPQED